MLCVSVVCGVGFMYGVLCVWHVVWCGVWCTSCVLVLCGALCVVRYVWCGVCVA